MAKYLAQFCLISWSRSYEKVATNISDKEPYKYANHETL